MSGNHIAALAFFAVAIVGLVSGVKVWRLDAHDGIGGDKVRSAYFTPSTDPAYDIGSTNTRPRDGQFTLKVIEGQTIRVQSSLGESVYVVVAGRLVRVDDGQLFTPGVQ